jgi:MFS family permease
MIFSVYYRYYSATIIQMTGVRDQSTAIWLAAVTAFVNFIFTLVGVWLVDKIGRRKLILSSLGGIKYIYIYTINEGDAPVDWSLTPVIWIMVAL